LTFLYCTHAKQSAQTIPGAILHFQKTIAPLTRKKLV